MSQEAHSPKRSDPPRSDSSLRWPAATDTTHDGPGSPAPEDTDPLLAQRAGDYTLREFIGGGAMGRVYRAQRSRHQKQAAIKVLAAAAGDVEGLLHEALDHPNIVRADSFGVLTDRNGAKRPYIVMEYMGSAATLDQWLADQPRTLEQKLALFDGILKGVGHAHAMGVLHHDLKPANILIDRHNTPKVADFGLARLRIESSSGYVGGTRAYESPEQCRRPAVELDARSDIYALGVVLFQMITGALPVLPPADSSPDELYRIKCEQPPMLWLLPADTPRRLQRMLKVALDPVREHRYGSVAEMQRELTRVRSPGALEAVARSATRVTRRRPLAATTVWATLAGITLAAVLTTPLRRVLPYERWALNQLPALDAAASGPLEQVRIVRLPEDPQAMARLAEDLGIEGVLPQSKYTWRRLHASFLEAMADAGARVTALDMFYRTERPEDERLAAGIAASIARGTPVVIGAENWMIHADGRGDLPEAFWRAGVRWGSSIMDPTDRLPLVPLASGPQWDDAVPGFATAVYAAAIQPLWRIQPDIRDDAVRLRFYEPTDDPGGRRWTAAPVRMPITSMQLASELSEPDRKLREVDWVVAYSQSAIRSVHHLDQATLQYADLMRATPQERTRAVSRQVLVLIDPGYLGDMTFDLGLERPIFGGEVFAGAIDHLLAGAISKWAPPAIVVLASAPAAALGALSVCGIFMRWPGRWPRWAMVIVSLATIAALAAAVHIALLGAYTGWGLIILPTTPMLALLAAAAIAAVMTWMLLKPPAAARPLHPAAA